MSDVQVDVVDAVRTPVGTSRGDLAPGNSVTVRCDRRTIVERV